MKVKERLEAVQKAGGLRPLGRKLGISPGMLHDMLAGRRPGTYERQLAIAGEVGISYAKFWGEKEQG